MLNKERSFLFLCLLFGIFIASCSGTGGKGYLTWYVKPYDPQGVNGNGASYCEAWNGIRNIDWSQIEPGDTIYLCGTFTGTIEIKKSGDIGRSIKIVGNCPRSDCGKGESGIEKTVVMPVRATIEKWGEDFKGYFYLIPPSDSGILAYRGEELKRGVPLAVVRDDSLLGNGYKGYIKLEHLNIPQYQCNATCPDDNDSNFMNHLQNIFSNMKENQYYYETCCNVLYWKPSPSVRKKVYIVEGIGVKLKDVSNISIEGVLFIGGGSAISFEGNRVEYIDIRKNTFRWVTGKAVDIKSLSANFINVEENSFLDSGVPLYAGGCVSVKGFNIRDNKIHRSSVKGVFINANMENIKVERNVISERGVDLISCERARYVDINFNDFYNMSNTTAVHIDTSKANSPEMFRIQFNLIRNAKIGVALRTYDAKHPYIYNNTFYKNEVVIKWISPQRPRKPAFYFVNNILYETTDFEIYIEPADSYRDSPMLINNNIYFRNSYNPNFYINGESFPFVRWIPKIREYTQNNDNERNSDFRKNPEFTNETGLFSEAKDFKLRCNSPLIDSGSELENMVKEDFFGGQVPVRRPDIGFHEFQGQPCPP